MALKVILTPILWFIFRDDDILYISAGEGFIPLGPAAGEGNATAQTELIKGKIKNSHWVTLNVGGKYFTTSRSTLVTKEPNSMLARWVIDIFMFVISLNRKL